MCDQPRKVKITLERALAEKLNSPLRMDFGKFYQDNVKEQQNGFRMVSEWLQNGFRMVSAEWKLQHKFRPHYGHFGPCG